MKLLPRRLTIGAKINRALRYFLRLIIYLILGGTLLIIPLFGYFLSIADLEATPQFKNRRWALPARVYARPLELYVGANIKQKEMVEELDLIRYQNSSRLNQPGSYRVNDNVIELYTRSFGFSNSFEPQQKIQITFTKDKVTGLKNLVSNEDITLVRVEPLHIASIYPAHNEDRILLKREEIPPMLIDALIAMEDRQFYKHLGVNPKAILRALIENMRAGKTVQGGSTLTQQLVKNFFLTPAPTLERKIQEMFYALVIDWRFSKDEIVEAYINEIYLSQDGNRAIHGFGLASKFFFGKPVGELSLGEIATLIGIIPSPSSYNPRRHPEIALKRRNLVLDVLVEQNLISKADAEKVKATPLRILNPPPSANTKYPAFIELVYRQLRELYSAEDLSSGGLRVFTTLDPITQKHAEDSVKDQLPKLEKFRNQPAGALQAAVVIAKNQTGEVVALVGDRDTTQAGFNRALNSRRSIGSLVKPFIYARALEEPQRYSLATPLDDANPFELYIGSTRWAPNNFDRRLHGWIPLKTALAKSYNIPTVRLGMDIGVSNVLNLIYRMGLSPSEYSDIKAVPATLLGALDLSTFDVTQLYSTMPNSGYYIPLRAIREITSSTGETLTQNEITPIQAMDPGVNYLIVKAMEEVSNAGTGRGAKNALKVNMGTKTGTSNDYRDSWFGGYTGNYTAVAWVGRDDNRPTRLTGASGALKLWVDVMQKLYLEDLDIPMPDNVVMSQVDLDTGLLPPEYSCSTTKVVTLPFIRGYQPRYRGECYEHYDFEVDKQYWD